MAVDDLIGGVVERNPVAFTQMYERHHKEVYTIALALTGNVSAAEDVTQDVFTAVLGDTFVVRGDLRATLHHLAQVRAREYLRNNRRDEPLEVIDGKFLADSGKAPDEQISTQESCQIVATAVTTLPIRYRDVIQLWQDGMTHVEIAEQLRISQKASRNAKYRALTRLRSSCENLR